MNNSKKHISPLEHYFSFKKLNAYNLLFENDKFYIGYLYISYDWNDD